MVGLVLFLQKESEHDKRQTVTLDGGATIGLLTVLELLALVAAYAWGQ